MEISLEQQWLSTFTLAFADDLDADDLQSRASGLADKYIGVT